jgi:hypothetical protein
MDIQEKLRQYGRDSRLLGQYRAEFNALSKDDPKWDDALSWLKRIEGDVAEHEDALVASGLMRYKDRYTVREGM